MAFIPRDFDFAAYEDQEIAKIVAPDAFTEFTIKRYITSILKDILQHLDANYDTYERIPLLNKKTDVCSNTRSHLGDLNMYMEDQNLDLSSFVKNVQKLRGNLVEEVPFTKKAIQEKALTITGTDGTARWLITLLATNFILMPFGLTPHEELPYFIPTALLITHIVAALEIKNQKKIYKKRFRAVLPLVEKLGVLASEEDILYSEGLKDMRSQPSTILAFLDGPIAQIIKKETAHASNKIQELTNALAKLKAEEKGHFVREFSNELNMRIAKVDDEIKKWKNFRENLEGFDQELANKREAIRIATGDATLIERQRDEIANLFSEVDALLIDSTKDLEDTLVSLRGTVDSASDALTDSMHTLSALEETTASLKKLNIDNVQSYLAAENEVREMLLQKEKKINAFKKRQEKKGRE